MSEKVVDRDRAKLAKGPQSRGSVQLDAMRGIAALIVFLNHTRALYFSSFVPNAVSGPIQRQANSGNSDGEHITLATEAVVIFFVLSGYLVGGSVLRSIRTGRWTWGDYLLKRLTRLLVVLIPALLLGFALDRTGVALFGMQSVYGAPVGQAITVTWHVMDHLRPTVLLGNLFFLQGILVPEAGSNVSLWSLADEFWYYLIFPFLALSVLSKSNVLLRAGSVAAAVALLYFTGREVAVLFPIWLLGAVVAALPKRLSARTAGALSAVLAVVLVGAMLGVRFIHLQKLPGIYVVAVVSSLLLYVLVMDTNEAKHSLYRRVASFFSQISYSLYMFHLPIAVFLCAVLDSPWRPWPKTSQYLAMWAAADALILLIVFGLWKAFEANTDAVRFKVVHWMSRKAEVV